MNNKTFFKLFIINIIIYNKILLNQNQQSEDFEDNYKNKNEEIKIIIKYTQKTNTIINHFYRLKETIEAQNKNYIVIGEDYKLEGTRKKISYTIIILQFILSAIVTCSDSIIYLTRNFIPRYFFDWTNNNKIIKVAFIFIIGNVINSIINNIQPFEIYYNENLIWSGIEHNGRLIRAKELLKLLQKKIK